MLVSLFAPKFVLVDVDSATPLAERTKVAAGIQRQVREHFAPAWGVGGGAEIRVATPAAGALPWEVQILLVRNLEQAGALGYHDRLKNGDGVIYVSPTLASMFGEEWSTVVSHEVLEYLADPYLNRCVQTSEGIFDFEVCDRVQSDWYLIDGVRVSNFSLPATFEPPSSLLDVKYDFLGKTEHPNACSNGGYKQRFDPNKGWVQLGQTTPYRAVLAGLGLSRGARRAAAAPVRLSRWARFWRFLRRA